MYTTKMTMFLPAFIFVDDYHEFRPLQDVFNKLIAPKVKVYEVGYGNSRNEQGYVGLVYTGVRPTKREIKELLKRKRIDLNDE